MCKISGSEGHLEVYANIMIFLILFLCVTIPCFFEYITTTCYIIAHASENSAIWDHCYVKCDI